jgi:predicted outer membrane protein
MRPVTVVLLAAALVACNRGDDGDDVETTNARRDTTPGARPALFSEAEAIGVLHAISDAEMAMARVARERSQNDAVLGYAGVMLADHGAFKEAFSAPARDNALSTRIRAAGDSIAQGLASLQGGLNNTYIEEQIKAHQEALQLLDTAIVPSVRDTAIKNLLTQARPTIVAHLQRAMQILSLRRKEAQERGEAWVSGLQQARDTTYAAPAPVSRPAPVDAPAPTPVPADTLPPPSTTNM